MPTLDWLDRQTAFSVANNTATHVLSPHAAGPNAHGIFGDAAAALNNLLIQGDNLQALKALLPFYRGQVKCIFIDPPYGMLYLVQERFHAMLKLNLSFA